MTTQETAMNDTETLEHGDGRNVYLEPRERALIRTANIYQTELDDGVEGYSKTLLSIVANCTNGGKPDGYNVQAMVGRSKRGEVAVRMFAVVDDSSSDPVFMRAGFQVRGCAAMVACASVACSMIEGKPFSAALRITADDIERAVDGLAPARRYTALFAAECIRALVGDWMYRCGMGLAEMDEHLGCDEGSVACLMCEHCSLRDSRVDLRVAAAMAAAGADEAGEDEPAAAATAGMTTAAGAASDAEEPDPEAAARELAENNALAAAFDEVRRASAAGKLATWENWEAAGIVPAHMETAEFSQLVLGYLESWNAEHAEDIAREQQERKEKKRAARSATHCVGVPPKISNRRLAQIEAEEEAADNAADVENDAAATGNERIETEHDEGACCESGDTRGSEIPSLSSSANTGNAEVGDDRNAVESASDAAAQPQDDDPFASLNVPEGYRLVELDGEIVLVKDESTAPARKTIDCSHVAVIEGLNSTYLYDEQLMTQSYAHWAFLAAEDDPVTTFAECVREDSRVYPRPYRASNLQNEPFNMSAEDIEAAWERVRASEACADIERTSASNGDVYFYSTRYLSAQYAASLAEYASVIRPACV